MNLLPLIGARAANLNSDFVKLGPQEPVTISGAAACVRALRPGFVEFTPDHKLALRDDVSLVEIRGTDDGIWRTPLDVPFTCLQSLMALRPETPNA